MYNCVTNIVIKLTLDPLIEFCWSYLFKWTSTGKNISKLKSIKIYHACEGGIEKSVPRITDWHHEACQGTDFFLYPHHLCLTRDWGAAGSSLTGITALCL